MNFTYFKLNSPDFTKMHLYINIPSGATNFKDLIRQRAGTDIRVESFKEIASHYLNKCGTFHKGDYEPLSLEYFLASIPKANL